MTAGSVVRLIFLGLLVGVLVGVLAWLLFLLVPGDQSGWAGVVGAIAALIYWLSNLDSV